MANNRCAEVAQVLQRVNGANVTAHVDVFDFGLIRRACRTHTQARNMADTTGEDTQLQVALDEGHVELAQVLLKDGADVTTLDESELTPLHLVSSQGHAELVLFLFGHDVDAIIRVNNKYEPTLVH